MLIPQKTKVTVRSVKSELREFLNKDGQSKVKRLVVNISAVDGEGDWLKITAFDPTFELPKEKADWVLPTVRKFECFDGILQNVML